MENKKIKLGFVFTSCKSSGPIQQMYNLMRYLDRSVFEPVLITLYDEPENSRLGDFLQLNVKHCQCKLSKKDIILGRTKKLYDLLKEFNFDVIHSMGVFPDYAVSKYNTKKQFVTLHNYVWEDYPAQFGKVRGFILAQMQLYAMKRTAKTVACSQSLAEIYKEKLHLNYDYICNGVDVAVFQKTDRSDKKTMREKLKLPSEKLIFVYSASIIPRKNHCFLIESFLECLKTNKNLYLLLLGSGSDYDELFNQYGANPNIDFRGNVSNVREYLAASDMYISTSKSEGMPTSVLEAMAMALPVILSDIPQHKEIFARDDSVGLLYKQGDSADLQKQILRVASENILEMGKAAYDLIHSEFSAEGVSRKYQEQYKKIAGWS